MLLELLLFKPRSSRYLAEMTGLSSVLVDILLEYLCASRLYRFKRLFCSNELYVLEQP